MRSGGDINEHLELLLYRNQFQLATSDALYSDGDRYMPAITIVKALKEFLPQVQNVLVLGTGLGSMVRVMHANGYDPEYTLVEHDKTVLGWALEFMDKEVVRKTDPVCSDAELFMSQNKSKYGFVFIDIFNGRVVPDFVTTSNFLQQCRNSLSPGGKVAFNYIVNNAQEWEKVKQIFAAIFPGNQVISKGINKILIS